MRSRVNETIVAFALLGAAILMGLVFLATSAASAAGPPGSPRILPSPTLPIIFPPGPPENVVATAGDHSATVTWDPPLDDGGAPILGYKVTSSPATVTILTNALTTHATFTTLANCASYTFNAYARNVKGYGPAGVSNAVTPLPAGAGVPAAPTSLKATGGDSSAWVTWATPAANGCPILHYSLKAYAGTTLAATQTVAAGATSFNFSGLTNGTRYSFVLTARNAFGAGSPATSNKTTPAFLRARLPAMANHAYGGYTTVAYLQNTSTVPTDISIQYFDTAGNRVGSGDTTIDLGANANWTVRQDNGNSFAANGAGSALVYSVNFVAGFVNEFAPSNTSDGTSYAAIQNDSATLYAPAIASSAYGGYTTGIGLVNVGDAATNVTVTYRDNGGAVQKTQSLGSVPAHAYVGVYSGNSGSATDANLPAGWAGTATISGDAGSRLAAVVNEVGPGNQFSSYDAAFFGFKTLFAPTLLNNAYGGYFTAIGIQNTTATPGVVTITYYDSAGTPTVKAFNLSANGYLPVYQGGPDGPPASGTGYTGEIDSTVAIAAIVNEVAPVTNAAARQSTAYNTSWFGSLRNNAALVESAGSDGWSTAIGIMNVGTTATTVTVAYYDAITGAPVGSPQVMVLPAKAFWGVYQPANGLPNGTRATAVVTTSTGGTVVSVVNEQAPNSMMSYLAQIFD